MCFIKKIFSLFSNIIKDKNIDDKKLELFNADEYKKLEYSNHKKCPNCGFESHTNKEIQKDFGLMHIDNHTYIQSWCRECRKGNTPKQKDNNENIELFKNEDFN